MQVSQVTVLLTQIAAAASRTRYTNGTRTSFNSGHSRAPTEGRVCIFIPVLGGRITRSSYGSVSRKTTTPASESYVNHASLIPGIKGTGNAGVALLP